MTRVITALSANANTRGPEHRAHFALLATVGLAVVTALALAWFHEEPSKLRTILVAWTAYLGGVGAIEYARQRRLVAQPSRWLTAFLLKILVSWMITQYFWAAPLEPHGALRVPDQALAVQDSNLYDYVGARLATEGFFANIELIHSTWLSAGIITYIATIYGLFGVSVFYISLCNSVLALVAALFLMAAMRTLDRGRSEKWEMIRWTMLLPMASYCDATPAKEPLTLVLFHAWLYLSARLLCRQRRSGATQVYLAGVLVLLAFVRINVALLVVSATLPFCFSRLGTKKTIVSALATVVLCCGALFVATPVPAKVLSLLFGIEGRLSQTQTLLAERESSTTAPLKVAAGRALVPRSAWDLVALAPIRMSVWLCSPFPFLLPDLSTMTRMPELLQNDPSAYVGYPTEVTAQLSACIVILLLPNVIAGLRARAGGWRTGFLRMQILIPAIVISNLMFIMGRRYRTLIEPMLVAAAIWGLLYGRRKNGRAMIYAPFVIGVAAVTCYQAMR